MRFELEVDVTRVLQCNCSHCSKNGWLLLQVPPERSRLLAGAEVLKDCQFNTHRILRQFCPTCGVHPFSRPAEVPSTYMVNVRCMDDLDLEAAAPEVLHYDGRSV